MKTGKTRLGGRLKRLERRAPEHEREAFFVEEIPPQPKEPLAAGERWVLDVEQRHSSHVGVWRRTSDPNDEGRFPGNPKAPLLVSWEGGEEGGEEDEDDESP